MVCEFGLSAKLGPISYPPAGHPAFGPARSYSEETQRLVDTEVAALVSGAEDRARNLLTTHREALAKLTAALLTQETISGDEVRALAQPASPALEPGPISHSRTRLTGEPQLATRRVSR
jgi:cell division protease FtsH